MNSEIIENVKSNIKNGMELFDREAIRRGIEIWKPIDGYSYEISSFGNVRNTKTGRLLKQNKSKKGYYNIDLSKDGNRKTWRVHRLVAIIFIPNPINKACIDHINNNKTDNNVNNLRWATYTENNQNKSLNSNNTSGNKGITWENNKYRAHLGVNGKKVHLGYYNTLEEAKEARQKKAKELFGEFINTCEQ